MVCLLLVQKQAVEQFETNYDDTNLPRDGNDLAALLLMIHNQKNNSVQNTTYTTAWLHPCDVFVFGSAKNKVRKAMKHALNTDKRPSILMSCDELHKAIHDMRSEDIIQCWMNISHQTIDELKGESASSSLESRLESRSTAMPT